MTDKIEQHERDIIRLDLQFDALKELVDRKFNEVLDGLKPQFSNGQIAGFLLTMFSAMIGIMLYSEGIKSDTRVNTVEIKNAKEIRQLQSVQYDNITKMLNKIQTDVAVLKNENN